MSDEGTIVKYLAGVMVALAVPTFISLVFFKRAPYGRYFSEGKSYGYLMNGKTAWILQEAPCVVIPAVNLLFFTNPAFYKSTPNMILLSLFCLHYIHR